MTEIRVALLIEIGVVYGPPATWNVVPAGVTMICAGVDGGGAPRPVAGPSPVGFAGAGGVVAGGVVAGGVSPGGVVVPVPGGVAPAAGAVGAAPAGGVGVGATVVGTGDVPGGSGGAPEGTPNWPALGGRGTPGGG